MPQNHKKYSGSPHTSEPEFLLLGKLRRAHGVKGEIPLEVYTEMLELLAPGSLVFIGDAYQPLTIEKTRWKQELLLLKFKEIDDRTVVSELTNALVYVRSVQLPTLTEGEIYSHEIVGLSVYTEDGEYLGTLEEILETGANDVFIIKGEDGQELLIPDTVEMILEIDLAQGKIIVARMEWYDEGE